MKKKNNKTFRTRNFSFVLYDDPADCFSSLLSQSLHYAYIKHDNPSEGNEPHYHLLVLLKDAKTNTACRSLCTSEQNVFSEPIIDKVSAWRYLRHLDNPEKPQYDLDNVVTDSLNFWQALEKSDSFGTESGLLTLQMLDDIIAHKPLRDMVAIYGRDFVRNYTAYKDFAERLRISDNISLTDVEDTDDNPF